MRRLIPILLILLLALSLAACGGTNNTTGTGGQTDNGGATGGDTTGGDTGGDVDGGTASETPMAIDGSPIDGTWTGTMDVAGTQSPISVTFDASTGGQMGTIDIPDQGVTGQALEDISLSETGGVTFGVAALDLMFDGMMTGDTLSGDVTQSGTAGTFTLTRGG